MSLERDPPSGRLTDAARLHDTARPDGHGGHTFVLDFDAFALKMLTEQAAELNVSAEELISFSVLYYLADLDSHRISRRLPSRSRFFDRD